MSLFALWVVMTQLVLLPVLGFMFLGVKREREKKERLLNTCLKALGMIVVVKGNGRGIRSKYEHDN